MIGIEKKRELPYAENEYAFEFCEPKFYKLVTTVTPDDYIRKFHTVPVVRYSQQTTFEE